MLTFKYNNKIYQLTFFKKYILTEKGEYDGILDQARKKSQTFIGNIPHFLFCLNKNIIFDTYYVFDDSKETWGIFSKENMGIFIFTYLYFHSDLPIFQKILFSDELFFKEDSYYTKPNIQSIKIGATFYNEKNGKTEHTQNKALNLLTDKHIWNINKIKNITHNIKTCVDIIGELITDGKFLGGFKYNYVLYAQNFATFFRDEYIIGSGIDRNQEKAKIKAIAEGFERYSSGGLKSDTYIELSKSKIDTQLFHDIYLNSSSITTEKIQGIPVYEIIKIKKEEIIFKKNPTFLPKECGLYLLDKKDIVIFNNSNGVASHSSLYQAFLHAYYEILERDSIALIWYYKLQPPRIIFSNNEKEQIFGKQYFDQNFIYEFYDISLDKNLPHILCIARNKNGKFPFFFASASVKDNIDDALRKSHDEIANMILTFSTNTEKYYKIMKEKSEKLPGNTLEHLIFYTNPKNMRHIEFLWKHSNVIEYNKINCVQQNIHNIQPHDLYICNLTTLIGEKEGIFTVKCFSRKYIPFWFGNITFPKEKILQRGNVIIPILEQEGIYSKDIFEKYKLPENQEYAHFFG